MYLELWYKGIEQNLGIFKTYSTTKKINVSPTKSLQQVPAHREKYTFQNYSFFTLNRTNQILQQNCHWFFCQKLTNKLTKKSDLQKNH